MGNNKNIVDQLIKDCLAGREKAYHELYKLFAPKLMTITRRYSQDSMEAEDMLQSSFVNIFKNLHSYSGTGSFEGWVRKITVHTALREIKKRLDYHSLDATPLPIDDLHQPNALDQLSEEEIIQLINRLPEGYRAVFNLYIIEGYSHKEIGELLNIGESTSRSQLTKAKKMLQSQLITPQDVVL